MELGDYNIPVSILPVLSKDFVKNQAVFIEEESVGHQYQSGCRKSYSAVTLLKLQDYIKNIPKRRKVNIAIFNVYAKAFDTIDFSILIK